jgi:hypothetical protein
MKVSVNLTGFIIHKFVPISGRKYVSTITCENFDGFVSSKSSNGVIVDDSPPITGKILDRNANAFENQYQSSSDELDIRWSDGYDPESDILEYLIAVGSGSNENDIRDFVAVGLARGINLKNLNMASGSTYFVTLKIVNKAGIIATVSSNGITIDTTPPQIKEVCVRFLKCYHKYKLSWNQSLSIIRLHERSIKLQIS